MKILFFVFTLIFGSIKALSHDKELDCLTMAVYYEAGNQTLTGKMAVANVIENRLDQRRYPDTYCEVVKQRNQFSFYWDGLPEPMPKNSSKMEKQALLESRIVATIAYIGLLRDNTHGSDHYHSHKVDPVWTTKMTATTRIGDHTFYTSR